MNEAFLAPAQAYILLAVAATVGSIAAALVQSLLPRASTDSAVVPEQSFAADRRVIGLRIRVVTGFGTLLILAWSNVAIFMLRTVHQWTFHHWLHYVGLLSLLVVLVAVMVALSDRLNAVSTTFVEGGTKAEAPDGPTDGPT